MRVSLLAILLGGLVAGVVDVGAAAMINGVNPVVILRAIAAGLLGKAAFKGGMTVGALGFCVQLAISVAIAAIYSLSSGWLPILSRQWIAGGLAYGVCVFFVMNYVVAPLSAIRKIPHFTVLKFGENMLAMLIFGLIISFCVYRAGVSKSVAGG